MTSMEPKLEKEVEVVWDSNELRHLPSPPPLIPLQSYQHGSTACSNRDLVQAVGEVLECPVCNSRVSSVPVRCCSRGHILCTPCWAACHTCPVCREDSHTRPPCYSHTASQLVGLMAENTPSLHSQASMVSRCLQPGCLVFCVHLNGNIIVNNNS